MVDMTYQTQYIREAPEIEARKKQILAESYRLYNEPMDLPFVESAGMS